ncbi:hypothetical protein LTS10_009958 [Elasticomyces elasticus]|nr:hypothetical protein LTS10_009958 [Elasticomyces elasticus]
MTNILIATGFAQGVSISWWRKAMGPETKLGDLHRHWQFGTSAIAAAISGKRFNFIAFASILVAITPANGPLLQRSSSVVLKQISAPITLHVNAIPSIDANDHPTGVASGRGKGISLMIDAFSPIVQSFYNDIAVNVNNTGCPGDSVCTGRLQGVGLALNCSSYTTAFNHSTYPEPDYTTKLNIFHTGFGFDENVPGNLNLYTQYMLPSDTQDMGACEGNLLQRECLFRPATVLYPVVVNGNGSIISLDPSTTILDDTIVEIVKIIDSATGFRSASAMGGVAFALSNRFDSSMDVRFAGTVGWQLSTSGATGPQSVESAGNGGLSCSLNFTDPTQNLIAQARELMFRTALAFGNSSTTQEIAGAQLRTTNVYQSHYEYLAAAVVLTLASISVVTATLYGFWALGRSMSMSPLEIAKAFNAPLLAAEDSNAQAEQLVRSVGARHVRYQEVHGDAEKLVARTNGSPQIEAEAGRRQKRLEIVDAN